MEQTPTAGTNRGERRRQRRIWVPGIALLRSGGQPPSVWRVHNLSAGGAALIGDGALVSGALSLTLHVAGFEPLEVSAKVLRRQLVTRGGRCGVRFVNVTEPQRRVLAEILAVEHAPAAVRRRALVVAPSSARGPHLAAELAAIGFAVRHETSPGQAAAWLQRESADVLLVDESAVEADRWSLLQFAHDTAPEMRRLVLAADVRGFRLYFAMKAGLVDALVDPSTGGDELARQILAGTTKSPSRRSA